MITIETEEYMALKNKQWRRELEQGIKGIGLTSPKDGKTGYLLREAWTMYPDTSSEANGGHKFFVFERMKAPGWDKSQYRFGYYVMSKHGTWVWANCPPMINMDDFTALLAKAVREGVILTGDLIMSLAMAR